MSLHPDTLTLFRANKSFLFLTLQGLLIMCVGGREEQNTNFIESGVNPRYIYHTRGEHANQLHH